MTTERRMREDETPLHPGDEVTWNETRGGRKDGSYRGRILFAVEQTQEVFYCGRGRTAVHRWYHVEVMAPEHRAGRVLKVAASRVEKSNGRRVHRRAAAAAVSVHRAAIREAVLERFVAWPHRIDAHDPSFSEDVDRLVEAVLAALADTQPGVLP